MMDPNLALNGNTNTAGSCAISRSQDGSAAWWQVDMGDSFLVMSVTVTSSANSKYHNEGIYIYIYIYIYILIKALDASTKLQTMQLHELYC